MELFSVRGNQRRGTTGVVGFDVRPLGLEGSGTPPGTFYSCFCSRSCRIKLPRIPKRTARCWSPSSSARTRQLSRLRPVIKNSIPSISPPVTSTIICGGLTETVSSRLHSSRFRKVRQFSLYLARRLCLVFRLQHAESSPVTKSTRPFASNYITHRSRASLILSSPP